MAKKDTKPLFTVIIPTKNRSEYLRHTLRTCTLQEYENLEIIVSDDGSVDNTRALVNEFTKTDPRIRYVSPGCGVGMWANFEFALSQVKPGFLIALGGDDGLLPYGISEMNEALQETNTELLAWPAPLYFYPKVRMDKGQLILHAKNGALQKKLRIVKSVDYLSRQSKNLNYIADIESPMFYVKGVTSTKLIDKVRSRSKDGRFYSCSTPDGFSGIVLAGEVESYSFSTKPFAINGVSPTSQGSVYLGFNDQNKKQSGDFFRHASDMPMHNDLASQPYSPLISLMTADYLLTAKDLPGWNGTFPPIDYKNLLVKSLFELNGLWLPDRISRELSILHKVACHHGLDDFFRLKVKTSKRDSRKPLEGNALSPKRIYLDANQFGIKNVFDAAYVAHYSYQIISEFGFSTIQEFFTNSIKYWLQSQRNGLNFPEESEWLNKTKQ